MDILQGTRDLPALRIGVNAAIFSVFYVVVPQRPVCCRRGRARLRAAGALVYALALVLFPGGPTPRQPFATNS